MKTQCIVLIALTFGFAAASSKANAVDKVTPIQKVITLIEELLEEVKSEAKEEAKTYDEFACKCKDMTKEKSDAITEGQTEIDKQSAVIADNTATLAEKETELADLVKQIDRLTTEMAEAEAARKKEAAEAAKVIADLEFAHESLVKAIEALEASKPGASLIEIKRIIRKSVALAEVLGMALNPKRKRAINALLQTDQPEAPEGDYEFHSDGIIDILKDLEEKFAADVKEKTEEEEKAQKAHEELMKTKQEQKETAEAAKEETELAIADAKKAIADGKKALLEAQLALEDDQLYLKDLTERCELKAREWDQRSVGRADEIKALSSALEVIQGGAADNEAARAMLVQKAASAPTAAIAKVISNHRSLDMMEDDIGNLGMVLLQKSQSPGALALSFLQKAQGRDATALEQRKQQVLSNLVAEGKRLGSTMLIATAMRLGPDPFKKVKKLIQALIERLLQEMAAEAGHKGMCDTELGKAKSDRDFRHADTEKLSAELAELEVKKEQLEEKIKELTGELKDLDENLKDATEDRGTEKEENSGTVKASAEGLEAIKEAIAILKDFYKGAAKNTVLIQVSPIDEEGGVGAGGQAQGAYTGKQTAGQGIIAMLEVIKSDFERSIKQTEEAEAESHKAHVLFDRQSKGSISGKSTAKEQAEGDLESTKLRIKDAMTELEDNQSLLDSALKTIEELKPICIDTGMSYEERVAAREAEIKALKKALCQLDVENVEEECA